VAGAKRGDGREERFEPDLCPKEEGDLLTERPKGPSCPSNCWTLMFPSCRL
jgi:hypothetical protein